jgi:hypothetical protein
MSTTKKRPLVATKGYRIVCVIDRIEEFDMQEGDTATVKLVTTKTIGSITTRCDIDMTKGKRTISLPGIDNVVITPDPSVKVCVTNIESKGGVGISIVM